MTQSQRSIIEKARSVGSSDLAIELSDEMCAYLVGVIVHDLGYRKAFPEVPVSLPKFFSAAAPEDLRLTGVDFWNLIERLLNAEPDSITYFSCLAAMHKARLKYARILQRQPIPTMDQVGPRGLLQYGQMSPRALAAFILWRKWLYDIDNRAAQETGYLFEPIIAHSIGGVPVSSRKSPVRRRGDESKGRQVDCIRGKRAYEIKIRVTIAASGQGRWQEELDFPNDCCASGYIPVLIVFDPTANPKLTALQKAFMKAQGEVYIGNAAWQHLDEAAGKTMAKFIEEYVRKPMESILAEVIEGRLPEIRLSMDEEKLQVCVAKEEIAVYRSAPSPELETGEDPLPDDIDEEIPGA